jgi:hypothetical protein
MIKAYTGYIVSHALNQEREEESVHDASLCVDRSYLGQRRLVYVLNPENGYISLIYV